MGYRSHLYFTVMEQDDKHLDYVCLEILCFSIRKHTTYSLGVLSTVVSSQARISNLCMLASNGAEVCRLRRCGPLKETVLRVQMDEWVRDELLCHVEVCGLCAKIYSTPCGGRSMCRTRALLLGFT